MVNSQHDGFAQHLWYDDDAAVLDVQSKLIGVRPHTDGPTITRLGRLWRAALLPAHVALGDPRAPTTHPPPFEPPMYDERGNVVNATRCPPQYSARLGEWPFAARPARVAACPLIAIQSDRDAIWPVGLLHRWGDLAGAGFRAVKVEGVPHYKLVSCEEVRRCVIQELAAAGMALNVARYATVETL